MATYGTEGPDVINGTDGPDEIYAGGGDDIVHAGLGNDTVYGGSGNDQLYGEIGDDTLYGEDGDDVIYGGQGRDYLVAGNGNDTLDGGTEDDYLGKSGTGYALMHGGDGSDRIELYGVGSYYPGRPYTITGMSADAFGDAGNDSFKVTDAAGNLDGGDGFDSLELSVFALNATVRFDPVNGLVVSDGTRRLTVVSVERFTIMVVAASADLTGGGGDDSLRGGNGADLLTGGGGADSLTGGSGSDIFRYGALSDSTVAAPDTIMDFQAGTDILDLRGLNLQASSRLTLQFGSTQYQGMFGAPSTTLSIDLDGDGAAESAIIFYNNTAPNADDIQTGAPIGLTILGAAAAETLAGSAFADVLNGGGGADILSGRAGADSLTGGSGPDVFRDTLADHYGDTITDFSVGDKIAFSDFGYEGFTYARVGSRLVFGAGALTLANNPIGRLITSIDPAGGVDLSLGAHVAGLNDFNGDGHSDLLWRNVDSGFLTTWQVRGNGAANAEEANVFQNGAVGNGWIVQGTMDFNADGLSDIVWRNSSSGEFTIWSARGDGAFAANAYVDGGVANDWTMAGFGDFNGDGLDDILWRNSGGQFTEWQSTGTGFTPNVYVNGTVGNDWKIVSLGDFNGDGRADILWRKTGGTVTEWTSTGNGFTPNAYVDGSVNTSWHVAATGDFNGDGREDILWRSDNGTITEWQSTGLGFNANVYVDGSVGTDWKIQGVFDFNDDGKADIVWRNDSGALTVWQSTGNGFTPNTLVEGSVGADWSLVTHHYDFV